MKEKYSLAEQRELRELIVKYKEDHEKKKLKNLKGKAHYHKRRKTRTDKTKTRFPCLVVTSHLGVIFHFNFQFIRSYF